MTVRSLVIASRPLSWINTCFPFLAAAIAFGTSHIGAVALGAAYFLIPYNLLMYGVNDIFDYESDRRNPRKGGIEGSVLPPDSAKRLVAAILITNVPLLAGIWVMAGPTAGMAVGLAAIMAVIYSAPPLRTKEIPGVDSLTSALHFVLPAAAGALTVGSRISGLPWRFLVAFFFWGVASHALGAIQDVESDRLAGSRSIATALGGRMTAFFSASLYAAAAMIVASAGGSAIAAGVALLAYVLLPVSAWNGGTARARRAWRGFLAMNLLCGFFISQLLLHSWGLGPRDVLAEVAWGAAVGVCVCLCLAALNEWALQRWTTDAVPYPRVTAVVPARNEARRIEPTLRSLLDQDYPGQMQVLVVDDGSSDGTVAQAGRILGDRGNVLSSTPAPEGWTGKAWACHLGAQRAIGDLLVFVDADTVLRRDALRQLSLQVRRQGGGMVSLLTRYVMSSNAERAIVPGFAIFQVCFLPITLLNRTGGRPPTIAFAFGPCMAVEATDYGRAGGHAAIASSQREDLDLGRLLATSGAPVRFLRGADLAASRHFANGSEAAACWRRTYSAYAGHLLPIGLAGILGPAAVMLLPPILLPIAWLGGDQSAVAGALVATAGLVLLRIVITWRERQPWSVILWHLVTFVVTFAAQAYSIVDYLVGRAPVWRGRRLCGNGRS